MVWRPQFPPHESHKTFQAKNHALSESLNKHKQGWMGTLSVAEQLKDQSVTLGQQLDDEKKTAR